MIVWLASFPRSGVTYLRHVLERLYGIPTWTLYKNEHVATGDLFDRARRWPDQADGSLPVYFVKTHMAETSAANQPAIHLVRDGRDTLLSLMYYSRKQLGIDAKPEDLLRGNTTLGHWGMHTMAFAGRSRNTAHVCFDALVREPILTVCSAVESLGLPLTPNPKRELRSFRDLQAWRPDFFRSGKSGQWEQELTREQQRLFMDVHGEALHWYEQQRQREQGNRPDRRAVA